MNASYLFSMHRPVKFRSRGNGSLSLSHLTSPGQRRPVRCPHGELENRDELTSAGIFN